MSGFGNSLTHDRVNELYKSIIRPQSHPGMLRENDRYGDGICHLPENFSKNHDSDKNLSDMMFCVTLYNEHADELLATLISLSQSLNRYSVGSGVHAKSTICVIGDGFDRLSPSVRSMITGMIGNPSKLKSDFRFYEYDADIFPITIDLEEARRSNRHIELGNAKARLENIEFCIKSENMGKLDSHKWFFENRCPAHNPRYCFQIDAGTTVTPETLTSMLVRLEGQDRVSAVASNVYIRSRNKLDLLESFQCSDFVVQRSVHWPAECASGYLSVIPGQFCGVKWRSLIQGTRQGHESVLDRYLAGMDCKSAAEKIMFMAEDRVISLELITAKGADNRVDFAIGSDCYTDACGTMGELLKQRRRWINSTFVCRGWMMKRLLQHLFDGDLSATKVARTGASIASMSWYHAMEFFQPLMSFLFLLTTYGSISSLGTRLGLGDGVAAGGFLALAVAWLMPLMIALHNGFKGVSKRQEAFVLWGAAASVAACTGINATNALMTGDGISLPLLAPLIAGLIALAASMMVSNRLFSIGRGTLLQYNLVCLPMLLSLFCYAFCNMSDTSWGTKGLNKANCGYAGKQDALNRAVDTFSAKFMAFWIACNVVVAAAIVFFSVAHVALSAIAVLLVLYFIVGFFGTVQLVLSKRTPSRPGASQALSVPLPAM